MASKEEKLQHLRLEHFRTLAMTFLALSVTTLISAILIKDKWTSDIIYGFSWFCGVLCLMSAIRSNMAYAKLAKRYSK